LKEVNAITRSQNIRNHTEDVFDDDEVMGDYEKQIELISKELNK
jgi:hypothetical protein